jgi:hypothetical protein
MAARRCSPGLMSPLSIREIETAPPLPYSARLANSSWVIEGLWAWRCSRITKPIASALNSFIGCGPLGQRTVATPGGLNLTY